MYSSWFNQNSSNIFFPVDENSRFINRNNENSISIPYHARFPFQRQQESRTIFQAINNNEVLLQENSFNFLKKEEIMSESSEDSSGEKVQIKIQQVSPTYQFDSQHQSSELKNLYEKKGLKPLARLIISILNKKKIDSSKYLTEEIQQILMKENLSKNERIKQSKNIRRRIYDALNVMISANVLGPDLNCIKRVNVNSFSKKCALVMGEKKQIQNQLIETKQRLLHKKKYLRAISQKKASLEWGFHKKQKQANNQLIKEKLKKVNKMKKNKVELDQQKINFPAIFVMADIKQSNWCQMASNSDILKLKFQNEKIQLFSQIECFSILKKMEQKSMKASVRQEGQQQQQQIQHQNLDEKSNFISFWNEKQIIMMD